LKERSKERTKVGKGRGQGEQATVTSKIGVVWWLSSLLPGGRRADARHVLLARVILKLNAPA